MACLDLIAGTVESLGADDYLPCRGPEGIRQDTGRTPLYAATGSAGRS
jgi:hypothetical protein